MSWLRSRQSFGVHVALLALVLKLALGFGHHHFDFAPASGQLAATAHHDHDDADHDHAGDSTHAAQVCFDCLTVAAASTPAEAPAPVQLSLVPVDAAPAAITLAPVLKLRAAFRSRAPPSDPTPA